MEQLQPIRKAAESANVSRNSIALWIKLGLLKSKKGKSRHMVTTLVSVKEVKELAKSRRPGRPRKESA